MERVNQRENHLLGQNIKRLRLEKNLRNKDIVAQLQVRGVEITTGTYSKVEMGLNNPSVELRQTVSTAIMNVTARNWK